MNSLKTNTFYKNIVRKIRQETQVKISILRETWYIKKPCKDISIWMWVALEFHQFHVCLVALFQIQPIRRYRFNRDLFKQYTISNSSDLSQYLRLIMLKDNLQPCKELRSRKSHRKFNEYLLWIHTFLLSVIIPDFKGVK